MDLTLKMSMRTYITQRAKEFLLKEGKKEINFLLF